ncbi:Zn-ribbon containing protein [Halorhabdus sp. SVX81]|uniref:OapC/ArvC family zinc-ribbon domain-containing protein n=1 Tax=Halorhabdus sp. SVX81 TaxID=2978283 RepID=UPI0023D99859|nr:Zn-ribbon containing protein [Halorhabdus sp. SVX81]WEL19031.1 Zn-ribbon containing protein [Halorhabdus sp. SVX81]
MPHQCTECGTVFEDGSTEMLSGCPECAGNTFQYHPGSDTASEPDPDAEPPERPQSEDSVARTVGNAAQTVKNFIGGDEKPATGVDPDEADPLSPWPSDVAGAATDTEDVASTARPETGDGVTGGTPRNSARADTATESNRSGTGPTAGIEDEAQASARSAVVSPDELPESTGNVAVGSTGGDAGIASEEPAADPRTVTEDRPDLAELREELNDQFESIRIVEPGQYELNLMELYEREEYIIALQEDGRYQIQVPDTWRD